MNEQVFTAVAHGSYTLPQGLSLDTYTESEELIETE